jgi:hypothetical protein
VAPFMEELQFHIMVGYIPTKDIVLAQVLVHGILET